MATVATDPGLCLLLLTSVYTRHACGTHTSMKENHSNTESKISLILKERFILAHGFSVWSAKGMFLDDNEVDVMEEGRGTLELLTLWYSGSDRSSRRGWGNQRQSAKVRGYVSTHQHGTWKTTLVHSRQRKCHRGNTTTPLRVSLRHVILGQWFDFKLLTSDASLRSFLKP